MAFGFVRNSNKFAAFTLVEVMVAAVIFTILAVSISALFVQNNQMSSRLRYRTTATNAALNILEQIRLVDFNGLTSLYASSATIPGSYVRVLVADPNAPNHSGLAAPDATLVAPDTPGVGADAIPIGYQNLDLLINVRDGVTTPVLNSAWNTCTLPLNTSTTGIRMPMRFWLTLKYNTIISGDPAITATGQVFELALIYQWQQPGTPSSSQWDTASVRAVVTNQNPSVIGS
jgi:prepilin-type N-terminal cleavage/methylation domain-containing protein